LGRTGPAESRVPPCDWGRGADGVVGDHTAASHVKSEE